MCDAKGIYSTRDQLANDRAKDKLSAEMGVRMFRFSGSDICRDPKGCARKVLHTVIFKNHLTPDQWEALNLILAPRPMGQNTSGGATRYALHGSSTGTRAFSESAVFLDTTVSPCSSAVAAMMRSGCEKV